jgi:hypothetical protein
MAFKQDIYDGLYEWAVKQIRAGMLPFDFRDSITEVAKDMSMLDEQEGQGDVGPDVPARP